MAHNNEDEGRLLEAKRLRERNEHLKAISILQNLRQKDAGWWAPVIELFRCYQLMKDYEAGLTLFAAIQNKQAFMNAQIYVALLRFFTHFEKWDHAKTYFQKLQTFKNLNSIQLVACARYLQAIKQHEKALKFYDRAIAANKKEEISAKLDKGRCLQEMNRFDEAITIFQKLHDTHPKDETVSKALICCLRENHQEKQAEAIEAKLQSKGASSKTTQELAVNTAIRLRESKRYQEALKMLATLDQADETVQLALARTHQAMHRFDDAIKIYTSLQNSMRYKFESKLALACCYEEMQQQEKCFFTFQQLQHMSLTPSQRKQVLISYARSLQIFGKYDDALAIYQSLLKKDKNDRSVQLSHARCLEEMGRFEDALEQYHPLLSNHPNDPSIALSHLKCSIKCLHLQDKPELAYIKLKQRFPNNINIAFSFLLWKLNNGIPGQYQDIFPPLIKKYPNHLLLRLEYATWLFNQGQQETAVTELNNTIARFSHSHQTYFLLVSFYCSMGQFNKAVYTYQNFLEKTSRTNVFLDKFSELFRQYGITSSGRTAQTKEPNQKKEELQILLNHAEKQQTAIAKTSAWGTHTAYVFGALPLYYLFFPKLRRPATIDFITNVDQSLLSQTSDQATSPTGRLTIRSNTITSNIFCSDSNTLGLTVPPAIRTNTLNYEQVYLNPEGELESPIAEIQEWIDGETIDKRPPPLKLMGDATAMLKRSPLDMLDIIDKATQLNIAIDEDTQKAMKESAGELKTIPLYRLNSALRNLFTHSHAAENIRWMQKLGILGHFFPELSSYLENSKEKFFHNWLYDQLQQCDDFVKSGHKTSYEFVCALCLTTPEVEIKDLRKIITRFSIGSIFKYERIMQMSQYLKNNKQNFEDTLMTKITECIQQATECLTQSSKRHHDAITHLQAAIALCTIGEKTEWKQCQQKDCERKINTILDDVILSAKKYVESQTHLGHLNLFSAPLSAKNHYINALNKINKFPNWLAEYQTTMRTGLTIYCNIADIFLTEKTAEEKAKQIRTYLNQDTTDLKKEICGEILKILNNYIFSKSIPNSSQVVSFYGTTRTMFCLPPKYREKLSFDDDETHLTHHLHL